MNKEVIELIKDIEKHKYAVIYEEDYKLLIEYINYLCKKINKLNKYINSNPLVFIGDTDIYVDDIKDFENGGWKNLKFFTTISKILGDKENE